MTGACRLRRILRVRDGWSARGRQTLTRWCLARLLPALVLAAASSGCVLVWRIPDILDETPSTSLAGIEYYRYEGETKYGERFLVRYAVDPPAKRRYRLVTVGRKVLESGWEDVAQELDAAARVFGRATERSEAEVRAEFGAPTTVTDTGQVQTWWYVRGRDEAFALLFRGGRLVTTFRTTERELERLLARSPPY